MKYLSNVNNNIIIVVGCFFWLSLLITAISFIFQTRFSANFHLRLAVLTSNPFYLRGVAGDSGHALV